MRFIILSDSKGKEAGINLKVMTKLLNQTSKLTPEPDFIVLGGDNVAGSSEEPILTQQLENLKELIGRYHGGLPIIPVVGNHEVNNEPKDDRYEKIYSKVYANMLPDTGPENYNKTAFYFDYKNTRFLILNSFHYGEINRISGMQLLWFKRAASVNIRNKIVFVHSPAFPTGAHFGHCLDLYPKDRDMFLNIAEKCKVDIVFSGHEHNYSRRILGTESTTYQVITGGAGEKLKDKFKHEKDVLVAPIAKYHFVLVDVDYHGIRVSAISSEGKVMDKFKIEKP